MSLTSFASLDALVAKLPFHLDDTAAVNACYVRWFETGAERDRVIVDLWTYCFIRRYFLVKFIQEANVGPAELEELIDRTFRKIERSGEQIRRPERYASWVSVVCKNTFLNFLRDYRRSISLDAQKGPQLVAESVRTSYDAGVVRQAVAAAIGRLPKYLQECAHLRFVEGLTYEEMHEQTGQPLPRIRSYVNKALKRLRTDSILVEYMKGEE